MSKQYRFETLQLHAGQTIDPTGARVSTYLPNYIFRILKTQKKQQVVLP